MGAGAVVANKQTSFAHIQNNTNPSWWKDSGLRRLNFHLFILFFASASVGYDGSLIGGLESIPRWYTDLGNPNTQRLSLMIASQSIGSVGGMVIAPWLPEVLGRKWAIVIGNIILLGGALGQTFCNEFIIGFGVVIATSAAPPLATELAHPRQFGRVASLYNCVYYAGSIIASWASFGTLRLSSSWSWRIPTIFQAIPAVIQILGIYWVPESPRWLVRRGRVDEARAILLKYHANGAAQDDLVDFEMQEISRQHDLDRSLSENGFTMWFKTPGMRRRLYLILIVGFYSQWAGNGIISYYFAPILNTVGVTSSNQTAGLYGGLAIWNACWAVLGASCVDKLGRRALWLISTVGMLVSYIIVTALSATYANTLNPSTGYGVIAFLFVFFAFYDVALTPLAIGYPSEILPNKARGSGVGITYCAIFLAQTFNTYCNPLALEALAWKYYIVYIAVLVVMLPVIWFTFPETRNRSLEEIAIIFDGDEADVSKDYLASSVVKGNGVEVRHDEGKADSL